MSSFYAHPSASDGHDSKCKECAKRMVRENREKNIERVRRYDRMRAFNEDRVEARRAYQERSKTDPAIKERNTLRQRQWTAKNQGKRKAHHKVNNSVRDGKISKQPCACCGATKRVHAHHDNYNFPLDVIWLCPEHHGHRHRILNAFCGGTVPVQEDKAA